MRATEQDLLSAIIEGTAAIRRLSEGELSHRPAPGKWSPKEVLGHLVDSAVHNLVRFTEAPRSHRPYHMRGYDQDELVRINAYQRANTEELLQLWSALNSRIAALIDNLSRGEMTSEVVLPDGSTQTLSDLVRGYVDHLRHHLATFSP